MSNLNKALELASRGFHVFPLVPGTKTPLIEDFPNRATRDEAQIRKWFKDPTRNIAISTTRYKDDKALCVVDVDDKDGRKGSENLMMLDLVTPFPPSYEVRTPHGGTHIVYECDAPLTQGADVLGSGLDIRSRGGYIVAEGSTFEGKTYAQINGHSRVVPAPQWLVDRLGVSTFKPAEASIVLDGIDPEKARARGIYWLDLLPAASAGSRNAAGYKASAKLKDVGCDREMALELMRTEWRCEPPLDDEELELVVNSAYKYGKEPQGISAPEAVFTPVEPPTDAPADLHPFDRLNESYAYVKAGAFILHETTNDRGAYVTEHFSLQEFHAWHQNKPFPQGNKTVPISQAWMGWADRRQYEGVVFRPCLDPGPRWFNLWRGFRVQPADTPSHPSVEMFKEHAFKNVCNGDKALFKWLMGFFAHMIQRPWEKPLVALVLKGKKGTGKNALLERIGWLLNDHYLLADDDRYLLGNFNSHLEANLFFVLDEASWAGDKRAEGKLKSLITGSRHNIERKGKEPYSVDNLTRIAIIGNEDWLVPASQDERRFAVFEVGDGRMQDRAFFTAMKKGMEAGGYAHLLRYLLDYDLDGVDVNEAPNTEGLLRQKDATLWGFEAFWLDTLLEGEIGGRDLANGLTVPTNHVWRAYREWAAVRKLPAKESHHQLGRKMAHVAPSVQKGRNPARAVGDTTHTFILPNLDRLRSDFDKFQNGAREWPA